MCRDTRNILPNFRLHCQSWMVQLWSLMEVVVVWLCRLAARSRNLGVGECNLSFSATAWTSLFFTTKKSAEEIVDDLTQVIDAYNATIADSPSAVGKLNEASPQKGSVIFGSAVQGWAFTIPQMA